MMTNEDDLIYRAWREAESYQVPMTTEGQQLADRRFYAFTKGWKAHKKSMEDFMDKGCIERGCPCYDSRETK
jgi:hypothetical protein